jgi:hypothetical protein
MPPSSASPSVPSLKEQMVRESCSMVRHLVTNGSRLPPTVIQSADQFETALAQNQSIDMTALASTHERLSRLVSPARPGTLYLLDYVHQQGGRSSSLGPVRLVQQLVRVAMVCVAVFIVLSVMAMADVHPGIDLIPKKWVVVDVILHRVFWLSAAGIGASFAMLFQISEQIGARTYDPDETASTWVKFFLGVVAGFILVALVPLDTTADTGAEALGPPTVALLGGFSASAVYRILTRMVEALESVFTGGAREQAAAAEKAAVTRAAEESSQGRMAVAGQLVDIQQRMAAGEAPERAAAQLRQVVAALVPSSSEFPGGATAPEPRRTSTDEASDKVPAFAVVSAPQDAAVSADASDDADSAAQRDRAVAASG